jgi:tetratricopeptide (TPR) repeat protein
LANAPIAFVTYLTKTFWPQDMAVFYPFPSQIPIWHVVGATFLIIVISTFVIVKARRVPYFFVSWLWYATTILPVIGIIQIGDFAMADRYHYLPSIGIAIGLAWGIPSLINENIRGKILFPIGMAFFIVLSVLSWKQCGHWKNSITLFSHALQVTKDNYLAHSNLGLFLCTEGKINEALDHYNKAIRIKKDNAIIYTNRGVVFTKTGKYYEAINDFNEAIRLKPDYADAYSGRGNVYVKLDQHQIAIEDYNKAIVLNHNDIKAYNNRGVAYYILGQYQQAVEDYNEAIRQKPDYAYAYYNRGNAYYKLGQYQRVVENYSETIRLKPSYVRAYNNRGNVYFLQDEDRLGCRDAQKTCELGECKLLKWAKGRGLCSD